MSYDEHDTYVFIEMRGIGLSFSRKIHHVHQPKFRRQSYIISTFRFGEGYKKMGPNDKNRLRRWNEDEDVIYQFKHDLDSYNEEVERVHAISIKCGADPVVVAQNDERKHLSVIEHSSPYSFFRHIGWDRKRNRYLKNGEVPLV